MADAWGFDSKARTMLDVEDLNLVQRFRARARARRGRWDRLAAELADARAMYAIQQLVPAYIPWTSSSMRPSALVKVVNEIQLNERRSVVECGSGISTVVLASALRLLGGKLISLESDPRWADVVRKMLIAEGVDEQTCVVMDAPLRSNPMAIDGTAWYSIDSGVLDGEFDLLLVDGPEAWKPGTEMARYPALPILEPLMSERFTVILDDADRPGEKSIARRWAAEFRLDSVIYEREGISLLRRDDTGAYVI